jgi:large subunit ribosomal protein L6
MDCYTRGHTAAKQGTWGHTCDTVLTGKSLSTLYEYRMDVFESSIHAGTLGCLISPSVACSNACCLGCPLWHPIDFGGVDDNLEVPEGEEKHACRDAMNSTAGICDATDSIPMDVAHMQGPKGQLSREFHPLVSLQQEANLIQITRNADTKEASAMHGLSRALCFNMIHGVHQGFQRKLQVNGVGYRAAVSGQELTLTLGYSHPVIMKIPEGVKASVSTMGNKDNLITLEGVDNEILGNLAATVRSKRPPEPYKGKGVRYLGENIIIKPGKSG